MRKVAVLVLCVALSAIADPMAGPSSASAAGGRGAHRVVSGPRLADPVLCADCYAPALRTSWQWQLQGTVDRTSAGCPRCSRTISARSGPCFRISTSP